jgi:uncharacterized protein (TIGR02421 family)
VPDRLQRIAALDRRVVEASKGIRILGALSWAPEVVEHFLTAHRAHRRELPRVVTEPLDHHEALEALAQLKSEIDSKDPLGRYLDETAGSYALAARMLEVPGTDEFLALSVALYGRPEDRLPGSTRTHLDAADELLQQTQDLADAGLAGDPELVHSAEVAQEMFQTRLDAFFGEGVIDVVIDPDLASKAAAGSKRLRIRGKTGYSARDIDQLVQHEAFVHTATALNGRAQPLLSSMSLGAPRTTLTQEGLATVAELVTRTIDVGTDAQDRPSDQGDPPRARGGPTSWRSSSSSSALGRARTRASARRCGSFGAATCAEGGCSPRTSSTSRAWSRCTPSSARRSRVSAAS